jgi:excisionase family DNA binding protein
MLTVEEAAERLRVSRETVRRWVRMGRLAGVHVGRHWLIPPAEIERVLSAGLGPVLPPAPSRQPELPASWPVYQAHHEPSTADRRVPRIIGERG